MKVGWIVGVSVFMGLFVIAGSVCTILMLQGGEGEGIRGWKTMNVAEAPTAKVWVGPLRAGVSRPIEALRWVLQEVGSSLKAKPIVRSAMAQKDGKEAQALFEYAADGETCVGLAMVDLSQSRATCLVGRKESFQQDYPHMAKLVTQGEGGPRPRRDEWVLDNRRLSDGTTLKLPQGWAVTGEQKGMVSAQGPDGAVDLGCWAPVAPRSYQTMYGGFTQGLLVADYTSASRVLQELFPQIAQMLQQMGQPYAQFVKINEELPIQGPMGLTSAIDYEWDRYDATPPTRWRTFAHVMISPTGGDGQFMYYTSSVHAPARVFPQNLKGLLKIWASYKVSDATMKARLDDAARNMREIGRMITEGYEERTRIHDGAMRAWDYAFRGLDPVRDNRYGEIHDAPIYENGVELDKTVEALNRQEGYQRYEILDPKTLE